MAAVATLFSGLYAQELTRLSESGKVYFWPMRGAMDQYLAERISAEGIFGVVVDPKLANAVMTDRIDSSFLEAMDELFPTPESKEQGEKKSADESKTQSALADNFQVRPPKGRALARPHGTLFLVDVQSRRVIWSTYLSEFDSTPDKLHKQSRIVADKLKKQLNPGSS